MIGRRLCFLIRFRRDVARRRNLARLPKYGVVDLNELPVIALAARCAGWSLAFEPHLVDRVELVDCMLDSCRQGRARAWGTRTRAVAARGSGSPAFAGQPINRDVDI